MIKDVPQYEQYYSVSSEGIIFSKRTTGRNVDKECFALKPTIKDSGYCTVMLYDGQSYKRKYVHRIVAEAFIPNPYRLPQINHKDENKSNNHVSNLEWCTAKYNLNYGHHNKRVKEKLSRPIVQLTMSGEIINRFSSAMDAYRCTHISQASISKCCAYERKSAGGYRWEYALHFSKEQIN